MNTYKVKVKNTNYTDQYSITYSLFLSFSLSLFLIKQDNELKETCDQMGTSVEMAKNVYIVPK